jgi:hypothetical protein
MGVAAMGVAAVASVITGSLLADVMNTTAYGLTMRMAAAAAIVLFVGCQMCNELLACCWQQMLLLCNVKSCDETASSDFTMGTEVIR